MNKYTCPICVEEYNSKNTICFVCKQECCAICFKKYILNSQKDTVNCMNRECNAIFPKSVLTKMVSTHWLNTAFKVYKNDISFKSQSMFFPEIMGEVEKRLTIDKLEKEKKVFLKEYGESYIKMQEKNLVIITQKEAEYAIKLKKLNEEYKPEIIKLKNENIFLIQKLKKELNVKSAVVNLELQKLYRKEHVVKHYNRPCSLESCKGLLDNKWTCGICSHKTCSKCIQYIENSDLHTCDENDIMTVDLLKKDTKNCPSCGEGIFKISGCDHMFCTICKTAFSWNTGEITSKNIHNPHYFDYLRRNAQNAPNQTNIMPNINDVDCLRMPEILTIITNIFIPRKSQTFKRDNEFKTSMMELVRLKLHSSDIYTTIIGKLNNNHELQELRINYLLERITEENFKKSINTIYKRREMFEESNMLIQTIELASESIVKKHIKIFMKKTENDVQNNKSVSDIISSMIESYQKEIEMLKELIETINNENNKINHIYKLVNRYNIYTYANEKKDELTLQFKI
jgi:hypothetical protein